MRVSAEPLDDAHAMLRFEVSDTGIGIDAGRARAAVRALHAGRRLDHPPLRRHRPRPGDLAPPRRADGRRADGASAPRRTAARFRFTARLGVAAGPRASRRSRSPCPRTCASSWSTTTRPTGRSSRRTCSARVERLRPGRRAAPRRCRMLEPPRAGGLAYQVIVLDSQMPEMGGLEVARARSGPARSCARAGVVMLTSTGDRWGSSGGSRRRPLPDQAGAAGAAARGASPTCSRASRRAAAAAPAPSAAGAAPEPTPAIATRGRVLVVEDNAVNQVVIEAMLGKRGLAVDLAEDGARGADHARTRATSRCSWTARCPTSTATRRPRGSAPASPAASACRSSR